MVSMLGRRRPKRLRYAVMHMARFFFIDEAYALYYGDDRNADYGREAPYFDFRDGKSPQ